MVFLMGAAEVWIFFKLFVCQWHVSVKEEFLIVEAGRQLKVTFPAMLDKTYSKYLSPLLQASAKICHKIDN